MSDDPKGGTNWFEALHKALLSAFPSLGDLAIMVKFKFNEDLDVIAAGVGDNRRTVVFKLIKWAEAQGRVRDLVGAAMAEVPQNAELLDFIRRFLQYAPPHHPAPPPDDPGGAIVELAVLTRSEPIRGIVVKFTGQFERTRQQVTAVTAYKEVHDALHDLQDVAYDAIMRQPREDPNFHRNLREHVYPLLKYVAALKNAAPAAKEAGMDVSWIATLDDVAKDLDKALSPASSSSSSSSSSPSSEKPPGAGPAVADDARIETDKRRLQGVVTRQPSMIDVRLNERAKSLELRDLVEGLTKIERQLSLRRLSESDSIHFRQFADRIQGVIDLEQELTRLVDRHSSWQELTDLIRLTESDLPREAELERPEAWEKLEQFRQYGWNEIRARFSQIPVEDGGQGDDLFTRLIEAIQAVDTAVKDHNPPAILEAFRQFRTGARDRFYFVDKSLKKFCDRLSALKEPLDQLLAAI